MADRMSSKSIAEFEDFSGDAVDLIEITGIVKWFDVAKGFGFIVPDNGMQDVLLHVSCLRRDGYQTILEGTRIVALIATGAIRPSAFCRWISRQPFIHRKCRRCVPMFR